MIEQYAPQDQLSQVVQQLAQLAINRYEIDQQIGQLHGTVLRLNLAIAQQQPKADAEG